MSCRDSDRPCESGHDPRRDGQCVRCGMPLPEPPSMERDTDFEARCLREAAASLGLEHIADHLHTFASRRALDGPVLLDGRDFIAEWLEEAADGVGNYGPWQLQRMQQEGDEDAGRTAALWEALRYGLLMYNALLRARD